VIPAWAFLASFVLLVPGQVANDAATPDPPPVHRVHLTSANPKPAVVAKHSGWEEAARICIVNRESNGQPRAQNRHSTASGLYQFLDGTWHRFDGYRHAKDAPPAVQTAKFWLVWNHGKGRMNWYWAGHRQCW
jgi:hypothetical protein